MSWQVERNMNGVNGETADEATRAPERRAMLERIDDLMAMVPGDAGASLDPGVRAAMMAVERHRFVPERSRAYAYDDRPLPIGHGQTISQPFIVAFMTQLAGLNADSVVLEIGTGCGYQAAVLAQLARRVYSLEIVPELAERAERTLAELAITNVEVRCADGFAGWEEHAPYDAILLAAAAPKPPPPLLEQLRPGGRMIIPIGEPAQQQELFLLSKRADGTIDTLRELPVAFVPLTRDAP